MFLVIRLTHDGAKALVKDLATPAERSDLRASFSTLALRRPSLIFDSDSQHTIRWHPWHCRTWPHVRPVLWRFHLFCQNQPLPKSTGITVQWGYHNAIHRIRTLELNLRRLRLRCFDTSTGKSHYFHIIGVNFQWPQLSSTPPQIGGFMQQDSSSNGNASVAVQKAQFNIMSKARYSAQAVTMTFHLTGGAF